MPTAAGSYIITDWKRLWQLVSGIHFETPVDTVFDELLKVSKELQDGVLQFRPQSATNINLETMLVKKNQEKLLLFTHRLQDLLDLESEQCWELLCFYLTKEYCGSANLLTTLISTESSMYRLLDDIWDYYSLERMIVLKIVKNMLIFYNVSTHPYQKEYKEVVDKITLPKLRESYLKQLEHLINIDPPSKMKSGEFFNYEVKLITWSERTLREINEILHIIILLCEHLPINLSDLTRIFFCIKKSSFGKQQNYLNLNNAYHADLSKCLSYSQVMLMMKCLDFENPRSTEAFVSEILKTLEMNITSMYYSPEHGPLLLTWMLLNLRSAGDVDDPNIQQSCRQLGRRALDLRCFEYLHSIVTHTMFQDDSLVSRIVRRTIYNQLCYMCDLFDTDGSCAKYSYIYELLCELLSWPQLAKEFSSKEEGGVHSLYNTLLEVFPQDFKHLSEFAYALTKGGQGNYIKTQLECLPILTQIYDESIHKLRAKGNDEYDLVFDLEPYPRIDFKIPAGSTACVMMRPVGCCVHIRTEINFFIVLHHEINCLLSETAQVQSDFDTNERIQRVNAGLKYLCITLQYIKSLSGISTEMVHPTEMSIDILNKFKCAQQPPLKLLATCLNVCTGLLHLVDTEIFTRVINLNIFPVITNTKLNDFKKYANGTGFESRLLGTYVNSIEKKMERFDVLQAYVGFLRTYAKLQRFRYFQVEIPGMIFILREVFPSLNTWQFKIVEEKNKLFSDILGFICDILDMTVSAESKSPKSVHYKEQQLLRDICIYKLLNLDNGLNLLRFLGVGNSYLQQSMEKETNWMLQKPHGSMVSVRLSMRILMQLLRLRHSIYSANEVAPLESLIYTQPKQCDTLRIIPIVTSYMSNIFDRWLPILSCRLLKRIALEFNMSLLACLDMDADQIRLTFLHKLPDELESDSVKIAILELVDACIQKQPGVTEALFKVNYGSRQTFGKEISSQIGDSILTYMDEFLNANDADPLTVEHVLPCKIMNLFHSLWKQNLQMLVNKLSCRPRFWSKLCSAFFHELRPKSNIYTQLLNILAIEIYGQQSLENGELKEVINKFFETQYFEPWLQFIFNMPKVPFDQAQYDEMPDWMCRLQSFKDFTIILFKKKPKIVNISSDHLELLAEKCLDALVERADYVDDLRPFILLAELYLFILLSFDKDEAYMKTTEEEREVMNKLLQLMRHFDRCYEDIHTRARVACLSIIIKCTQIHKNILIADSDIALRFLDSVVGIICIELHNLENSVTDEITSNNRTNNASSTLILALNLLKVLASIFRTDGPANWDLSFVSARLFSRLLKCTSDIIQRYDKQNLTLNLLDVLLVLAHGSCSAEFLHCDVSVHLWLNLSPPTDLLQVKYDFTKLNEKGWSAELWWPIYTRGIEFVTVLYEKHSSLFLREALQFVGIHELYLVDALLLGKQSLEPLAINLIKNAIILVAKLSAHHKAWREDHPQSLYNIMRAVQSLLGHSISMFHQPNNLKCLITGNRIQLETLRNLDNASVSEEVIQSFNDLTEIIVYCVKALLHFSPDLVSLLCDCVFDPFKWEPLFEVHFGAPKLSENNVSLTFGLVLSIVSVYVKALNLQNYNFKETLLNVLPACEPNYSSSINTELSNKTQHFSASSTQRVYTKSISVATSGCISNELLAHLNSELCLIALEHMLMLIASQSMFILRGASFMPHEKQLIRREVSAETLVFHEYVRRKIIVDIRSQRNRYVRCKRGQVMMTKCQELSTAETGKAASATAGNSGTLMQTRKSIDSHRHSSTDLRVKVVRKMHLQQQQQQEKEQEQYSPSRYFEMSRAISPIAQARADDIPSTHAESSENNNAESPDNNNADALLSSTPNLARPSLRRSAEESASADPMLRTKRVSIVEDAVVDNIDAAEQDGANSCYRMQKQFFAPDELQQRFSPLSFVQFVEEDYLHLMSILLDVICHSD